MKLIKKLKAYSELEAEETVFGFGLLKAKDYETEKYGHLILISIHTKVVQFLKKLFIPF